MENLTFTELDFSSLQGWSSEDHLAALSVFANSYDTCFDNVRSPSPKAIDDQIAARHFFEDHFIPTLIENDHDMLFTGYYEPEFLGARSRCGAYQYPIHAVPFDHEERAKGYSRREIEEFDVLAGQNLEIAWLRDPVDKFFLQVQGSGRIRLPDGTVVRVGYAAKNGYDYTSIGKLLLARGALTQKDISADVIRQWVGDNKTHGQALLWENESYVFFKELVDVSVDSGPIGTTSISITELRSIAVDPDFVPLGLPVWIEKGGCNPLNRLMVAQDTGSAIKGPQRADIYFGSGDAAGELAGQTNDGGRMVVLMPKQVTHSQASGQV